jgi:hypothetical protein
VSAPLDVGLLRRCELNDALAVCCMMRVDRVLLRGRRRELPQRVEADSPGETPVSERATLRSAWRQERVLALVELVSVDRLVLLQLMTALDDVCEVDLDAPELLPSRSMRIRSAKAQAVKLSAWKRRRTESSAVTRSLSYTGRRARLSRVRGEGRACGQQATRRTLADELLAKLDRIGRDENERRLFPNGFERLEQGSGREERLVELLPPGDGTDAQEGLAGQTSRMQARKVGSGPGPTCKGQTCRSSRTRASPRRDEAGSGSRRHVSSGSPSPRRRGGSAREDADVSGRLTRA